MKLCLLVISFLMVAHGVVSQPAIDKRKFHLFMLSGQSNMAGRGEIEALDRTTHPRVWVLNKKDEWELAKEPLHFDKPGILGVGPGFSFAKKMAGLDTNIFIGLIPCAVGGSAISFWEPAKFYEPTKSYPYDEALRRTKLAMEKGELKGILWHQGESDSDSIKSTLYAENLKHLVSRFRRDLKMTNLPFVAGTMAEFYLAKNPYAQKINEAIMQLANTEQNIAVVNSSGLSHKGDHTHFDSASARLLGERFAETFQTKFKGR